LQNPFAVKAGFCLNLLRVDVCAVFINLQVFPKAFVADKTLGSLFDLLLQ